MKVAALLGIMVAVGACWRDDLYPVTAVARYDGGGIQDLYVAPNGNDANPGTITAPLLTLARARDLVRQMNGSRDAAATTMTDDIRVYLRDGTYPQTSTLTFTSADSGSGGFYVQYLAYQDERPLITGGQPIGGWTPCGATTNLYCASAGGATFRQLYVNGVKAVRARRPDLGANGAPNFYRLSGYDNSAHNVQVASSYVANWNNLDKVEMHLMTAWADNTLRIASVTTSGTTAYITFQDPEGSMLFTRNPPTLDTFDEGPARAFYFENALEMLNQPGEWYLDVTADTLYYQPRSGENMATATVIAPVVETILSVAGASTSEPASYLWFQGLTFAHSTYLRPSQDGFLDTQSGQYNLTAEANGDQTVGRPAAGVSVMNANHIHFERNLFTQMAATGLDFISGTHDDMVVGNAFTHIGGNGISVGKFTADETTEIHVPYNPADPNEICSDDTLKDNYIDDVATEMQGASGIACGYPRNLDIEHNEVAGASFTAIIVGFGLTSSANAMSNNSINYNNIHDVLSILGGGAAIITISNQGPSSTMAYNYLHDFGVSQWADYPVESIFLDDGTSGYTVDHNVIVNAPESVLVSVKAGTNATDDNSATASNAQDTMATAGIEPDYVDIENLTVPAASF